MVKLPSFQFYPGDWMKDANLNRCSLQAQGAWIRIICCLHDSGEYGVLRWPLSDICRVAGIPVKLARELIEKGVLHGSDSDCEGFVHRPFHAGKFSDPIVLVEAGSGPCWFSNRMVRDDHNRKSRGKGTRFGETPKDTPNRRVGDESGYGPSSSSSSSTSSKVYTHPQGNSVPGSVMPPSPPLDPAGAGGVCEAPALAGGGEQGRSDSAPEPGPDQDRKRAMADRIRQAYPRRDSPQIAARAIADALDAGQDAEEMLAAVQLCAEAVRACASGPNNRYVPTAETFFTKSRWADPEAFCSRLRPADGSGPDYGRVNPENGF